MYPGMAKTAREEGFAEIADWFETLAKAEKSHAGRFQKMLDSDQLAPRRTIAARSPALPGPGRLALEPASRDVRMSPKEAHLATSRRPASPTTRPSRATGTRRRWPARSRAPSRSVTAAACASSTATASRASSSCHRRAARRRRRARLDRRRDRGGDGRLLPVQALRGAVPVHAARRARVPARLPQAGPPLRAAVQRARRRARRCAMRVLAIPTARQAGPRVSLGMANVMNRVRPFRVAHGEGGWASTATSCCPTSPRSPSTPGPRSSGCVQAGAGRRGGALPDLLRAEQRAADGQGHPRRAGARTASTSGW